MSTVLITGASSGIGAALAHEYACAGNTLILIGRNVTRLDEVAATCRTYNAQVLTGYVDVRDKEKLAHYIIEVDDAHPIDLVIANAGISAGGFSGESSAHADDVFAVNLQGVLNTIHPLIPRMVARGRGQIAIMSSLAGIRALPSAAAYSASKAAVRFYGDALRGELKPHNIQVSVICPGWITTPLTAKNDFPMPLLMSPERAARLIIHRLARKKSRIAFPRRLYFSLRALEALPIFLTDPLFARMPKKRLKL
jgi:short-subunit dehydrogenase